MLTNYHVHLGTFVDIIKAYEFMNLPCATFCFGCSDRCISITREIAEGATKMTVDKN